jgi:hypothetical protein
VLEPKALELLKAMSNRLTGAKSLSFTALSTYEHPSRIGPALAYTTRSEVLLQRPNQLRVITAANGPASEFYYDGKTVTAFAPAEGLVAVSTAPATLDATLKAAYDNAAIHFSFTDLIVADPQGTWPGRKGAPNPAYRLFVVVVVVAFDYDNDNE